MNCWRNSGNNRFRNTSLIFDEFYEGSFGKTPKRKLADISDEVLEKDYGSIAEEISKKSWINI